MTDIKKFNIADDTYTIPDDRHYERRSHMWAKYDDATGQVLVGIDTLGLAALGDLAYVTLPPVGMAVQRGRSMGSLEAAKMTGGLNSPVSGVVTACNEAVIRNPSLINLDAYTDGWMVSIQPTNWANESTQLVSGDDLPEWIDAELERYRLQGWID